LGDVWFESGHENPFSYNFLIVSRKMSEYLEIGYGRSFLHTSIQVLGTLFGSFEVFSAVAEEVLPSGSGQ
jgi:hypothetical protein